MRRFVLSVALCSVLIAAVPALAKPPRSWPPATGKGSLFVHFGEEHVNDADGKRLLTKVVRQSSRYRPQLVTMSGDKANNGHDDEFQLWSRVMRIYDRRGVPWLAGVGNHDRTTPPGVPGGTFPLSDLNAYADFFGDRPYPMGDAPGYRGLRPRARPATDPAGASSHYFADAGRARWIFIDNSCFSIILCDLLQKPSAQTQGNESQYAFLRRVAGEAQTAGRLAFVVMHMPTQDPRDQLHADPTSLLHTMGKGPAGILDNTLFEQAASESGVDGVFLGHIKGQFTYTGQGGVPYFIDGGAGGELYTTGPVGADHGYWHGYRTIRVRRRGFRTDSVPIFVRKGITIASARRLDAGTKRTFEAFGRQPVFIDPARVDALELRDPNPTPRFGASQGFSIPPLVIWIVPPLAVLLFGAIRTSAGSRHRLVVVPAVAGVAGLALVGISAAQQSEPTLTPRESLPNPARIWTSSNPEVLKPIASDSDDPRRNRRTQTADGEFRARCPGAARLTVTSGFQSASKRIVVTGGGGAGRC